MAVKKKAHEKLDNKNIQRVIDALNGENPITKKEACGMLHINYNTPRLSKIIKNYREEIAYRQKRMDRNRGKSATNDEKREIISQYLTGITITDIAKAMYRSTPFVKSFIDNTGVPTRVTLGEEFIVPDECVKEEFKIGEWVWFNDYHPNVRGGKAGKIVKDLTSTSEKAKEYKCKCYSIHYWTPIVWQEDFWAPWWPGAKRWKGHIAKLSYEIGSIQHLIDEYGLNEESL